MTPRDKALIGGLITIACVASIPLMFMLGGKTPPSDPSPAPAPAPAPAPVVSDVTPAASATPAPSAPPAPTGIGKGSGAPPSLLAGDAVALPMRPLGLALGSPPEVVETQRRLLEARDDEGFRTTFMPEVQRELTTEAIESCRKRLAGKAVKPDWEVAEESMERGSDGGGIHTVIRVSMFGKSMTGFHEVAPGRWLADAAWCVPIW